jgi:hypothetical protein
VTKPLGSQLRRVWGERGRELRLLFLAWLTADRWAIVMQKGRFQEEGSRPAAQPVLVWGTHVVWAHDHMCISVGHMRVS